MPVHLITGAQQRKEEADPVLHRSLHQFDRCGYDARNYGSVVLLDGKEVAHLLVCVHCRAHFPNVRIPGKERGWCLNCNGPVCPNPNCDACVPFFVWLESVERGLRIDQMPITVAASYKVPALKKPPAPAFLEG